MPYADDPVSLKIRDGEILMATEYDVRIGIFEQPSSFALQLGSGMTAADILQAYPKGSPFQLIVGGQRQFAGFTDGNRVSGDSGATEVAIKGRDVIKFLHDSFHERESTYTAETNAGLLAKALEALEMQRPFGEPGQRPFVLSSGATTRDLRTGAKIAVSGPDDYAPELLTPVGTVGNGTIVLRAKLGERWTDVITRNLQQTGLFMWGSADGDIVIGRPNTDQAPLYRIVRQRGGSRTPINTVKRFVFDDDLQPRYSEVVIYGRTTGRRYARTTSRGAYVDAEMVNAGVHKVLVLRDVDVTSTEHAELMAKRYLADCRRKGFHLEYTLAGHTTQRLGGRTTDRVVWAPDTLVEVNDEEIGLQGVYWIESVRFHRSMAKGTETTLRLLPPESLLFGMDAPSMSPDKKTEASAVQPPIGQRLRALPKGDLVTQIPKDLLAAIPPDVMAYLPPHARIGQMLKLLGNLHPEVLYQMVSFEVTSPHRKLPPNPAPRPPPPFKKT